ncbi:MAG: methyltransferase domain-containing protein [Pseudomonadota bacterium]
MSDAHPAIPTPDWANTSGDVWARRWQDIDAGLAEVSPHLLDAVRASAPRGRFKAFEVGCGPGSTTIEVADAFAEADVVACDISPALAQIARHRLANRARVRVVVGDAQAIAPSEAPLDVIFSRHGVMFFDDPVRAFESLRTAARPGAGLAFSCFRDWELNPWASEVASAAAGRAVPAPGREPGGFAFADRDYVLALLASTGWVDPEARAVDFNYVAGAGSDALHDALSFLADLGPAARLLESLAEHERRTGLQRMRGVIERHFDGQAVAFPAAAWVWRAKAG